MKNDKSKPQPAKHKKFQNKKSFRMPRPSNNVKVNNKWTVFVVILSFFLSVVFSAVTSALMQDIGIVFAFIVLFIIIGINVAADVIGTAVMNAEEAPLHSLARRRIAGASEGIAIIRQAPQISNLCCDVIGDIAGIISGAATALIVEQLLIYFGTTSIMPSLLLTGLVSSLTIGGKAVFKVVAMQNANSVVFAIGKLKAFTKKR
jgi:hypothetical protein